MPSLPRLLVCVLCAALLCTVAVPALADSKSESLKPLPVSGAESATTNTATTDSALEAKYREALETRLAAEIASHEGSLRSLWIANGAVWACLLAFVVMQALALRKREAELARLRAERKP